MVYVTGDTHANFRKFSTRLFPEQKSLTRDDFVIILGDFGGVWADTPTERYWLDWLNDKPFTTCFVDGNHENYDRLYSDEFDIVDFHGGKAHQIRNNVFHLMRGYVFEFCNKKFFCMGGASSHDIDDGILEPDDPDKISRWRWQGRMFRVNHVSWWEQEIPSDDELNFGLCNLKKNHNKVDFIISHCLPCSVAQMLGLYDVDRLTYYFDGLIDKGIQFDKWYCGHYHTNQTIYGKFNVLYENIERIV